MTPKPKPKENQTAPAYALKMVRDDYGSLTDRYGRVIYEPGSVVSAPGNGLYAAVTGGLACGGLGSHLALLTDLSGPTGAEAPDGVICYRSARVVGVIPCGSIYAEYQTRRDALNAEYQTHMDALCAKFQPHWAALNAEYQTRWAALNAEYQTRCATLNAEYQTHMDALCAKFQPRWDAIAPIFADLIESVREAIAAALASQKAASQIVLRGTSPGLASSTRVRKMGVRSDE